MKHLNVKLFSLVLTVLVLFVPTAWAADSTYPTAEPVTITITVDNSKTFKELAVAGKYDWIDSKFSPSFKAREGSVEVEITLLSLNKRVTSEQALAAMEDRGLRPASAQELLFLGIQYPQYQREFPIVALGTRVRGYAASLYGSIDERMLGQWQFSKEWPSLARFAAVRK